MHSTFNALILQSLIFLIESTLILFAFKNTKKIKFFLKKKKKEKLSSYFQNLAKFLQKNIMLQ
jgi:hypothetical protein